MNKFISNKFFLGGSYLNLKNKDPFKSLNKIKLNFKHYGIVIIDNFKLPPSKIKKFTDKFSIRYANDASRRETWFNNNVIRSVDSGFHEIPLHSESSFSNTCPEIIWFYGVNINNKKNAPTTICDGIKIWKDLPLIYKNQLLCDPLVFKVRAKLDQVKKKIPSKKWFIDAIGMRNPVLNYKKSILEFEYIKHAVNLNKFHNKISFCNHILSIPDEDQIISAKFLSNKKISRKFLSIINKLTSKYTYEHYWKKTQLIMIDNMRFMHGRRAIKKNEIRKIINIQTLNSNFKH